MYSIKVALRRFQKLIQWTSWKYSTSGNHGLSQEDLEAEGYLVLVRCCREFPDGEYRFKRFFTRSFHNRLKDIMRDARREKRLGVVVELDEALGIPVATPTVLIERIESLRPTLSKTAFLFLTQLANPSQQVVNEAYMEFLRRNKLHSQGFRVSGYRKCRIKTRHIRKVFGLTPMDCSNALSEIRVAYRNQLKGEKQHGR